MTSAWDARFGSEAYLFGTEPNAFLRSQAFRFEKGMHVLAVADGEGRNGVWLAGKGLHVVSLDASSVGLDKARKLAAQRNVTLDIVQADLADWMWAPARYDAVVAIFIQFAEPDLRDRIFEGIHATLKPGGFLVLQGYRREQLRHGTGGPPDIEKLYTRELLLRMFARWDVLHLEEHDAVIQEGSGHSGMSALVDLVARKPPGDTVCR